MTRGESPNQKSEIPLAHPLFRNDIPIEDLAHDYLECALRDPKLGRWSVGHGGEKVVHRNPLALQSLSLSIQASLQLLKVFSPNEVLFLDCCQRQLAAFQMAITLYCRQSPWHRGATPDLGNLRPDKALCKLADWCRMRGDELARFRIDYSSIELVLDVPNRRLVGRGRIDRPAPCLELTVAEVALLLMLARTQTPMTIGAMKGDDNRRPERTMERIRSRLGVFSKRVQEHLFTKVRGGGTRLGIPVAVYDPTTMAQDPRNAT